MTFGVIGSGNMGKAIGQLAANLGYEVLFAAQNPANAQATASAVGLGTRAGSTADAAAFGDIIVLATPFAAVADILKDIAPLLTGKILIDITNPLAPDYMSLTIGHTTSAGEEVAKLVPGAKVVKAFNTVFATVLAQSPRIADETVTVFVAGDDPEAVHTVAGFVRESGFDAVPSGPLRNARYLEPAAELMIQLAYGNGLGTNLSFRALRAAG